jgi:hypothetical protein
MDDLGKSIPAAEAFVDAETGTQGKLINEYCLNCGTKLVDVFCYHCGQKDIPRRQTLSELWSNFISSFWSYEGKFFQTTKYLILRPGFLAMEYNEGRRERYFHPARMYVFISFVFFLIYFSLPEDKDDPNTNTTTNINFGKPQKPDDDDDEDFDQAKLDSILDSRIPKSDSLKSYISGVTDSARSQAKKNKKRGGRWNFGLDNAEYKSLAAYDSAENTKPEAKRDGWLQRRLTRRVIELNNRYKGDGTSFVKDYGTAFKDSFSKVLFWLLPFFALVFKLLYLRKGTYYSEHLVFSIYYYDFFYLAGSVVMLLSLVPWLEIPVDLLQIWIYFYLLVAMKRVYQQRWGKTILKFILFTIMFSFVALIALSVSALTILMVL